MAEFNKAAKFTYDYLKSKEAFLAGKVSRAWFTSGVGKLTGLLDLFNIDTEDQNAYMVYEQIKAPKNKVPVDKEAKHRLRLLFMAACTQAARQQYMAGATNGYRTQNDTFRYEMANSRAVRGCLRKFQNVTEKMGQSK